MDFERLNSAMAVYDKAAADAASARLDFLAKPVGSLGELENALIRFAALTGSADIDISKKAVLGGPHLGIGNNF